MTPRLFVPLLLFFLSPRQAHGCCTAASAWAQCLHYSQGAVGVWEGRGEQTWCPLPPPRAKESLFRILRRQGLIIAQKGLAQGGPGAVTYRMSQTQAGERKKGWEGQQICSVLTWGHTGRLHTSQFGPVGEGKALIDRDSWE